MRKSESLVGLELIPVSDKLPESVVAGLQKFNRWLREQSKTLDLVVIGHLAQCYHKPEGSRQAEQIRVIDSVVRIDDEEIVDNLEQIKEFVISDRASSYPLPPGFEKRLVKVNVASNINLFIASQGDLIAVHATAASFLGNIDSKELGGSQDRLHSIDPA